MEVAGEAAEDVDAVEVALVAEDVVVVVVAEAGGELPLRQGRADRNVKRTVSVRSLCWITCCYG